MDRNIQQITLVEAWILQRNQQLDQIARRKFILATFKNEPDEKVVGNSKSNLLGEDQQVAVTVTAKEYREQLNKEIIHHEELINILDELINGDT